MRKLNTAQKVIFILGIIGVAIGIFGKLNSWEYKDYFIPFYTGASFMWIAFLNTNNECEVKLWKRIFKKG